MIGLFVAAGLLGWRGGFVLASCAGLAFVVIGIPGAAIGGVLGLPVAMAFVLGGMVGTVPVLLRAHRIDEYLETNLGDHARRADRIGGAVVSIVGGVVLAWFIGAVASIAPTDSSVLRAVRASAMLGALSEAVPPNGSLGSVVLRSGLVPSLNGPLVLAEPPDEASARTPGVLAAQSSVLQVKGEACGAIVTGTAWVAGPGLIVTNAHVVAGQQETRLSGGPQYEGFPAQVTAFDVKHDVAVLTAAGQALPPVIPLARTLRHGQPAAVIGFPRGGIRRVVPARIDRVATWDTEPVGGGAPLPVPVLAFRAEVQHGNSGGPILAEDGTALGLVVAKGLGQRIEAAYGVAAADLQAILTQGARRQPVSTGPCLQQRTETVDAS